MANKQYIGARYVPLIDGEWNENKSYEPLTVVSYLTNSYTSKTFVPAGTLPTNSTYWALTGNYNAGLGALTERVDAIEGDVTDIKGDINNINNVKLPAIEAEVASVAAKAAHNLAGRNFIFIADSYGNRGWTAGVISQLGLQAHALNVNGAGFVGASEGTTWGQALNAYAQTLTSEERAAVTDIIVLGGINDNNIPASTLKASINTFIADAHTYFPNAVIGCGNLGWCKSGNAISNYVVYTIPTYLECFNKYGYTYYIDKMFVPMHNYSIMEGDGVHPSADGITDIISYVSNWLVSGNVAYCRDIQPTLTAASGVTLAATPINTKLTTNGVYLSLTMLSITFSEAKALNGTPIKIGTISGGAVAGYYSGLNGSDATVIIPVTIYVGDVSKTISGQLSFKDGDVYINGIEIDSGNYVSSTTFTVQSCTAFIDLLAA